MENGAFYITDKKILEQTECRLGGKIGFYEMSSETGTEIDEASDWEMDANWDQDQSSVTIAMLADLRSWGWEHS